MAGNVLWFGCHVFEGRPVDMFSKDCLAVAERQGEERRGEYVEWTAYGGNASASGFAEAECSAERDRTDQIYRVKRHVCDNMGAYKRRSLLPRWLCAARVPTPSLCSSPSPACIPPGVRRHNIQVNIGLDGFQRDGLCLACRAACAVAMPCVHISIELEPSRRHTD